MEMIGLPQMEHVRDYIHIMDLAEAHIKTLDYLIFNHDKCVLILEREKV